MYEILTSKTHNPHYINRYVKFIIACCNKNTKFGIDEQYAEDHHICPKADDLFPEYTDVRLYPWNNARLTGRQHFLAHWMLWKAYGGSQAFAFHAMCSNQKSKYQQGRYSKINSRTYDLLKKEGSAYISGKTSGKATYKDCDGNTIHCSTTDPRVLSGELISTSKGRRFKRKQKSEKTSKANTEYKWRKYPIKIKVLYFLDIKIQIPYTRYDYAFIAYLDQGWSEHATPEYINLQRKQLCTNTYEKRITSQILNGDYSNFEYLYDTVEHVVLMGIFKFLNRIYPNRYIQYKSSKNFKRYIDTITGKKHQLDPQVFPIIDNFVEIPKKGKSTS